MWAVRLAVDSRDLALPRPANWTFSIPAKCPLPIELHQVACLCGGLPPRKRDSDLEYQDVPPIIQQGIQDRLALGNILEETNTCMIP